jgi:hypothetical protein
MVFGNALGEGLVDAASRPAYEAAMHTPEPWPTGGDSEYVQRYSRIQELLSKSGPPISETDTDAQVLAWKLKQAGYDGELVPTKFVRNNNEVVDERRIGTLGQKLQDANLPAIPFALAPKGVDPAGIYSFSDEKGQVAYVWADPVTGEMQGRHPSMFWKDARTVIEGGRDALNSGAVTPSEYLDAVRYLRNGGASF